MVPARIAEVRHISGVGVEAAACKYLELARSFGAIPQLVEETLTTRRFRYQPLSSVKPSVEAVVVRNTFLDVDTKPLLRRRWSFSEFGGDTTDFDSSNDTVGIGRQLDLMKYTEVARESMEMASTASYAGSVVDSCKSSDGSDGEGDNATPVRRTESHGSPWSTAKQSKAQPWDPKPKFSGKRRKSGWTRQRRSRALAVEEAASSRCVVDLDNNQIVSTTDRTPAPSAYTNQLPSVCAAYFVPVCAPLPIFTQFQAAN